MTTVVRSDSRTGRLVRSVVVEPKAVKEIVVKPGAQTKGRPSFGPDSTLKEVVDRTANYYNVEAALVHSVVEVESAFNPYAISTAGAEGLMQLMPSTAKRFGVKNSFDPTANIEGGVRYLKYLQDLYGNDLRKILAAYNAGEGAVNRSGGIPRYPETERYVYQVGKKLGQKRAAARSMPAAQVKPSAETKPPVIEHRPVEQYQDSQGNVYLRTK